METTTKEAAVKEIAVEENARTNYEKRAMEELTASIKEHGVLNPLLVRSGNGKGGYVLIAGHRRLRAAKEAGLKAVPVRILDVTLDEAREIQAIENLQRADLGPMEEAAALKALAEVGNDYDAISAKVHKPREYVVRAVRLLELHPDMQKAIGDGRLSAAHGHQVLRVAENHREALVKFALAKMPHFDRLPTVADLRDRVETRIEKPLTGAPFNTARVYADLPVCASCPFNSKNQGDLFDGAEGGTCTDGGCYGRKTKFAYEEAVEKGRIMFPDQQFMGDATQHWSGDTRFKNYPIVDAAKVKKDLEKKPGDFGWGVLRPSANGSVKLPKPVLIRIAGKGVEREEPDEPRLTQPTPEQIEAAKKKQFVDGWLSREVDVAVMETLAKEPLDNVALAELVASRVGDMMMGDGLDAVGKFLGFKDGERFEDVKLLKKRTASELAAVLRFLMLQTSAKDLGVNVKEVEERARPDAVRAWEAKKAAAKN